MRAVIILGNGVQKSINRALIANEIITENDIIIATGYKGEAKIIRKWLKYDCLIEGSACNTFTNFLYSFRMLHKHMDILIITDEYHSFRAYMIASIINLRFKYKHKIKTLNKINWFDWKEWRRLIFWNLWNHRRDLYGC